MHKTQHSKRAVLGAALTLFGGVFGVSVGTAGRGEAEPAALATERLEIVTAKGTSVFNVEVADTPARQAVGLMYRTRLAEGTGMLFPLSPPRESTMWMRNTYIPLDMVFIRADGTVHRVAEMTEPHSEEIVASNGPVAGVLEIAGGTARKIGLKPGDTVRHRHFGTVGR